MKAFETHDATDLFRIGVLFGPPCLILLSAVPTVLANVYLQELLGAARLWRQLALYIPYFGVQLVGFWLLVPRFGALGFGIVLLAGSSALLLTVLLSQWCEPSDKDSAGHRDLEFLRADE